MSSEATTKRFIHRQFEKMCDSYTKKSFKPITKEERHRMMRSEARNERKRNLQALCLEDKGIRFRYMIKRRMFWEKLTSLDIRNLMVNILGIGEK